MPLNPFVPRKLINIHTHIKRDEDVDRKVAVWKEQGAVRTCVQCSPYYPDEENWHAMRNEDLAPWLAKHGDHLIGFGGLDLSENLAKPADVAEIHAMGFRGLKCIRPALPYDDDAYMPLYEQAAKLGMPVLFHTGYLSFPPSYRGSCRVDHMRPARLERIARMFPELRIIGAHLGSPWQHEALRLLSLENVYFDICGGSGRAPHGSLMKRALAPFPGADMANPDENQALSWFADSLLFGTDNPPIERWVPRAEEIMDYLQIPAQTRENFYWRTAAELLGV